MTPYVNDFVAYCDNLRDEKRKQTRREGEVARRPLSSVKLDAGGTAYGLAALRDICAEIAAMPAESGRNTELNNKALRIGQLVAGGQLEEESALGALRAAGRTSGLDEQELDKVLRLNDTGGYALGLTQPAHPEPLETTKRADLVWTPPKTTNGEPSPTPPRRGALDVIRADDVDVRRVRYCWEGRIPRGAMTLMPGEEGIGKTTVGVALLAALTRGTLAGEHHGHPRNVIVLAPEDNLADVLVPRLTHAGADLTRVLIVRGRVDNDGAVGGVIVPRDLDLLGELIADNSAVMLWVDSLVTTMPDDVKTIAYKDTATVLRRLGEFAERLDVAVVAPWHLNKSAGNDTAVRMMDSRAFRTAVRSVLLVVRDPEAPEGEQRGIVALDKANGGTLSVSGLRYRITQAQYVVREVDENTGRPREVAASCGVVEWLGEVTGDARDIARKLLTPAIEKENSASSWLRTFLEGHGEVERSRVLEAAQSNGLHYSQAAVKRAAAALGVVSRDVTGQTDEGYPRRYSRWSLPQSAHANHTRTTEPIEPTGETSSDPSGPNAAGRGQ